MNSQFTRIVWKEYRAQRAFWLALLAGHAAISLLYMVLYQNELHQTVMPFMSFAVLAGSAFAIGSTALCFSYEEEERTALLMRMLPMSTRTLTGAKITTTVLGMITLLLACLMFSITAHETASLFWPQFNSQWSNARAYVDLSDILVPVYAVVLGLVCALYSRTTMKALLLSGLATAVSAGVGLTQSDTGSIHLVWLSILILISSVFATIGFRTWHRKPARLLPQRSRAIRLEAGRLSQLRHTWDRRWHQLLKHAATRESVIARTAAVVLWQECRAAVAFSLIVVPLAALSIVATALFRNWFLPTHVILGVLVIECGLRTFRHDQQNLNGLFWSHRGVSPGLVWCIRVATWFTTMLILLISVVLIEFIVVVVMQGHLHSELKSASVLATFETLSRSSDRQWMPIIEGFFAGTVGGFAIAQLASCWERKPLVAGLLTLISVAMFWVWTGYVVSFGMPLLLLVWPLVALAFIAGFMTRRRWMDRRTGRSEYFLRAATVLIPVAALWPLSQWYWATSVPNSHSEIVRQAYTDPQGTYAANGYTEANATGEWGQAWARATRTCQTYPAWKVRHLVATTGAVTRVRWRAFRCRRCGC